MVAVLAYLVIKLLSANNGRRDWGIECAQTDRFGGGKKLELLEEGVLVWTGVAVGVRVGLGRRGA